MLRKTTSVLLIFLSSALLGIDSDIEKAIELRINRNFVKAERLLKKYSSPVSFESLKSSEKIEGISIYSRIN